MLSRGVFSTVNLVVVFLAGSSLAAEKIKTGPFEILAQRIFNCPMEGVRVVSLESTDIKRTAPDTNLVTFNVVNNITVGEHISGRMYIARKEGDAWIENWVQEEFTDICVYFKRIFPTLVEAFQNMYKTEECDFPPSTITGAEQELVIKTNLKSIPYGEYRMDLLLNEGDKAVGCLGAFIKIVPRKNSNNKKKKSAS